MSTAPPACGWLRGTSRTSPGPPRRWRGPVWLRSTSARGRGFAAYLSACGGQPFNVRCAHYAREASLTTFGFVTTVPRYLPKASNSLTFVRGADRACCAPRKWPWRPTNVRLYQQPHALRRGIGVRTRQRHLAAAALTALVVRRVNGDVALFVRLVNGFADRPRPACTGSPQPPVGALACAPGSGTLPPVGFRGNAPDRRRHLPLPGGDGAAEAASDENRAEAAVAPDAGCRAEVAGAPAFDQSGFADQGA